MMDSQNNKKEPVNTNVNNKSMNTNINKQPIGQIESIIGLNT